MDWRKIYYRIEDIVCSTLYMLFLAGLLYGVFYMIELGTAMQNH